MPWPIITTDSWINIQYYFKFVSFHLSHLTLTTALLWDKRANLVIPFFSWLAQSRPSIAIYWVDKNEESLIQCVCVCVCVICPGHTGHQKQNPYFLAWSQNILPANDSLSWASTCQSSWQRINGSPRCDRVNPKVNISDTKWRSKSALCQLWVLEAKPYLGQGPWVGDDSQPDCQADKRAGEGSTLENWLSSSSGR